MDSVTADEVSSSVLWHCSDSGTALCQSAKGVSLAVLPVSVNREHSKTIEEGHDQVISDVPLCSSKPQTTSSQPGMSARSAIRESMRSRLGLFSSSKHCLPGHPCPDRRMDHSSSQHVSDALGAAAKAKPFSLILSLPKDILLLLLCDHLDFTSLVALRSTCRAIHSVMPLPLLASIRANIVQVLKEAEMLQIAAYRTTHRRQPLTHLLEIFYSTFAWQLQERPATHLTCYGCLELKPLDAFVERMSSRGTGLGGKSAELRRCKECMCRFLTIGGVWWREHWVRKSDTMRRRGRVERWARWITSGERLVKVSKEEEKGVCHTCGVVGEELYWGCVGCFKTEERRRRNRFWEALGLRFVVYDDVETAGNAAALSAKWGEAEEGGQPADGRGTTEKAHGLTRTDRMVKRMIEISEEWSSNRALKRRVKRARRQELGSLWRRVTRGGVNWEGSWQGRVEALVEHLNGKQMDDGDDGHHHDHYHNDGGGGGGGAVTPDGGRGQTATLGPTSEPAPRHAATHARSWRAVDYQPAVSTSRREQRCAGCWEPCLFRDPVYNLSLAYDRPLRFDEWCHACQQEQRERVDRRRRRRRQQEQQQQQEQEAAAGAVARRKKKALSVAESEDIIESMGLLFT